MTVSRYILLIAIVYSPLSLSGQQFTSPPTAVIDGPRYGFPPDQSEQNGRENSSADAATRSERLLGPPHDPGTRAQYQTLQQSALPPALGPRTEQRYSTPIWQESRKGGYFGIMGAIAQPGVYFHQTERIPLSELLKKAGGATSQASGGVRIVRQGRGGLQTFLSADSAYEVMNGDVLLLESNRFGSRLGQSYNPLVGDKNRAAADGTAEAAKASLPPPAYLAFVNLTPKPIIVPVPSDQATLATVLKWLRQDPQTPPFVRILPPTPALRQTSSRPVEQQLLETGTVLVFDPNTVLSDRLPEFPPVLGQGGSAAAPNASPAVTPKATEPVVPGRSQTPAPMPTKTDRPDPKGGPTSKPTRTPSSPTAQSGVGRDATSHATNVQPAGVEQSRQSFDETHRTEVIHAPKNASSHSGGPLLMPPQSRGPSHSPATAPDLNSRQPSPPRRLDVEADHNTSKAHHEVQPMGWQSRPPARDDTGNPDAPEPGVIQANGELGGFENEFRGPALELPQPVPKLLPPESSIPLETIPTPVPQALPQSVFSNVSMQVVWFSLGSMLLLVLGLWSLSRWDGPRPVRVALANRHAGSAISSSSKLDQDSRAIYGVLRFLKRKTKSVAEAPLPVAPVAPPASQPGRTPPTEPTTPNSPKRTISQQELLLRDHFRQVRQPHRAAAVPVTSPQIDPSESSSLDVADAAMFRADAGSIGHGSRPWAGPKVLAQIPNLTVPAQSTDDMASSRRDVLDRALLA